MKRWKARQAALLGAPVIGIVQFKVSKHGYNFKVPVEVKILHTIGDLKLMIHGKFGVPPEAQSLTVKLGGSKARTHVAGVTDPGIDGGRLDRSLVDVVVHLHIKEAKKAALKEEQAQQSNWFEESKGKTSPTKGGASSTGTSKVDDFKEYDVSKEEAAEVLVGVSVLCEEMLEFLPEPPDEKFFDDMLTKTLAKNPGVGVNPPRNEVGLAGVVAASTTAAHE